MIKKFALVLLTMVCLLGFTRIPNEYDVPWRLADKPESEVECKFICGYSTVNEKYRFMEIKNTTIMNMTCNIAVSNGKRALFILDANSTSRVFITADPETLWAWRCWMTENWV